MAKKLKAQTKEEDTQLANAVRTSAQQIWQAGLGAFAKAQEEGGRVFSKLVKEGTELQKRSRKLAENKASDVTGTVSRMAEDVGKQASGSWDKLEQVFEERVARALSSIGVPTHSDIDDLKRRIEQLSHAVAQLSGPPAAAAKVAPKPALKRSPAAKAVKAPVLKAAATPKGNGSATKAAASKATAKTLFPTAASKAVAAKPATK
jgi:poly(hydroxyalkanoate) granule-associated protein